MLITAYLVYSLTIEEESDLSKNMVNHHNSSLRDCSIRKMVNSFFSPFYLFRLFFTFLPLGSLHRFAHGVTFGSAGEQVQKTLN